MVKAKRTNCLNTIMNKEQESRDFIASLKRMGETATEAAEALRRLMEHARTPY